MAKRQTLNDKERAYQQAVRDAFQQWARDERQYIASLKDNLNAYRNQILADLPEEGTWAAHRRQQTIEMLDDAKATLDGQLSRSIVGASNQAINTALFSVEAPLSAFGMNMANISRQLPLEQIGFLQRAAPSLITNVSTQVHNDVGSLLQRYMAGGIRRQDLIRQIGAATGPLPGATMKPGQIIPRAEVRAQTIVRTEINSVSSLVQQHRVEELSTADKGVGSRWVHFPSRNPRPTHEALHGVTIFPGHGERFELSGVKITGPHDPALGAEDRISCHCKVSTIYDPTRSEAETDVHVGAATGSAAAADPTPKVPEPKAKPVAKQKKVKREAPANWDQMTIKEQLAWQKGAPAPAPSSATAPAVNDKPKPKPKPAAKIVDDDGPVTVSTGGWTGEDAERKAADVHNRASAQRQGTRIAKAAKASEDGSVTYKDHSARGELTFADLKDYERTKLAHAKRMAEQKISSTGQETIIEYQQNSYDLNRDNRGLGPYRKPATPEAAARQRRSLDAQNARMNAVMAEPGAVLRENTTFYRGIDGDWHGVTDLPDPRALIGKAVSDDTFLSVSMSSRKASWFAPENGYIFKIDMPAGTRGVFAGFDEAYDELEFVAERGLNMVVKSVERVRATMASSGNVVDKWIVHVEVVPGA